MRSIEKLSPDVIGKIAAGEVVERPAAAIKEMVENSMDAGASAVTVEIRDGGISYIRVADNGSGIPQKDIRMAFERHATSKIISSEDLTHIETLGFRGEALASIAAVSHVTLTTRVKGENSGITAVNEGGIMQEIREAACPEGTTFIVKDLFFNTPVRRKFLKKPAAEAALVSDLIMRLILSNPSVSFRLIQDGKVIYHSPGDGKLESAVYTIYGREMLKSMRSISGMAQGILLKGYVGIGDSARGTRSHQSFFLNGRYMRSILLTQALEQGCRERVTIGHYPTCVLHLKMPLEAVDVNVHPNKMEVRFQNENAVFEAVRDLIYDTLRKDEALVNIPEMELTPEQTVRRAPENQVIVVNSIENRPESVTARPWSLSPDAATGRTEPKSDIQDLPNPPKSIPDTGIHPPIVVPVHSPGSAPVMRETYAFTKPSMILPQQETPAAAPSVQSSQSVVSSPLQVEETQMLSQKDAKPDLTIMGVVFKTYILLEYGEQLLLIDQHAAHERLLFDQMTRALDQHKASQALLVPQVVPLTHREQETLLESQEALAATGFEISPFGDHAVQVRAVPLILGEPQAKSFLLEALDQLEATRGLNSLEKRRTAILQMACKRAVKGGERLPLVEIQDLVRRATETGVTPTCPHGRPLVVAITHQELDKRFKRIQ